MIPSDMPEEYGDYGYWNKPYFLSKAAKIGPNTKILIQNIMEKAVYPVQSFRTCHGILRFAEKYSASVLEACCREAILAGKCSYTYIANTVSSYAQPKVEPAAERQTRSPLKPIREDTVISGIYKDDDDKYSLQNLLKR